ncbi:hypothetical protein CEXT_198761 [Caerostris extrusa]|uniref:Uncharacterized protein n=1 Tax=Caerostris extrusa TaxID=172846 RepID=A0AAV4SQ35_CAEEX|nr:hypothetical protein CEXT_198761 [Caerostris extrusa]
MPSQTKVSGFSWDGETFLHYQFSNWRLELSPCIIRHEKPRQVEPKPNKSFGFLVGRGRRFSIISSQIGDWRLAMHHPHEKHRQVEAKPNKSFGFLVGWGDVSLLSVLKLATGAVAIHHPARGEIPAQKVSKDHPFSQLLTSILFAHYLECHIILTRLNLWMFLMKQVL